MTLLLLDTNSLIHRAWHSGQAQKTPPIGKFIGLLWDILNDTLPRLDLTPTHAAAILDPFGPNWRHEIFPDYKTNRAAKPPKFQQHVDQCCGICQNFGIPVLTKAGYEADDLIATYTRMACPDQNVVIVSQDKDLMQLIRDNVWMLDHRTGNLIRTGDVYARFGVNPDRLQDLLALTGDVTDGVIGVSGIGKVGAAALLKEYRSLHHLMLNAQRVLRKTHRQALLKHGDAVRLAYQLIELRDVRPHIPAPLEDLAWEGIHMGALIKAMYVHNLKALAERLCHATGRDAA